MKLIGIFIINLFILLGCGHFKKTDAVVSKSSIPTGTQVKSGGEMVKLYGGSLKVGDNLYNKVADADLDLKTRGYPTIISIVPSIDTPVCETQVHWMAEHKKLSPAVKKAVISRDLPMAQKRFAKDSGLNDVDYESDYRFGGFGRRTGLLMKGKELLARAVIVIDAQGVIKHLQVVPDTSELPDIDAAIDVANKLAGVPAP